ncbi:MAG: HD domain-containing protein [Negativicutes bacterium]|nr:HD domain-containing protein [Negativicutes bacterium]
MFRQPITSLLQLAMSLSDTLDLVSPKITNHHRKVAFIAYLLGVELNLPLSQRKNLMLAGVFHDIGALSLKERIDVLSFESINPHHHAEIGYHLLREFEPFSSVADIVRFHHVRWEGGKGQVFNNHPVPPESHIMHLADRIAVLLPEQSLILGQSTRIYRDIARFSGTWFQPELIEAFGNLAGREHFWLDATAAVPTEPLRPIIDMDPIELDSEVLQGLTKLFSRVIDFRSPFTATHSSSVAASAEILARLTGFSRKELQLMRVAGHMHDLGKLAVPTEILEKPATLSEQEWNVMRSHSYFGFRTLQKIPSLETVNIWGSLHHERLDGSGYPFHLKGNDLPLGSRIVAVADVFTALTEDRPYRPAMKPGKAIELVIGMARDGALDSNLVDLLNSNLQEVNEYRWTMAGQAMENYRRLFAISVA